jgi:Putative peptidoglycan binding domain
MSIDCSVPRHLMVMRALTGTEEDPGSGDNPRIMAMRNWIACTYINIDGMYEYCEGYTGDDVAWCGLTVAFAVTVAGVMPPFGPTDTDRFLWAQSFASDPGYVEVIGDDVPIGAIAVMTRSGGGHVTLFEGWIDSDHDSYKGRGGNQSDAVTVGTFYTEDLIGFYWPQGVPLPVPGPGPDPGPDPVEDRPTLRIGDRGPDVEDLQRMLPYFSGEIDGDFGSITERNVKAYQLSRGLEVDGICGPATWQALYDQEPPLPPPEDGLTEAQVAAIVKIANDSWISDYDWEDRGAAPKGWTQGMALAFAQSYKKLRNGHPAMIEMSKARTNSDKDALNLYRDDFSRLGMSNDHAGPDVLRHLYSLMLGHGMRESSGEHCCGRDQSASNYDSTTCEAGAFQTSYNAAGSSNPEFDNLMNEYLGRQAQGFLYAFAEGVSCSSSDWESYGSGRGHQFQVLCKVAPAWAAESCGLTLRNLANHYGPIIRHESELKEDANTMFQAVQDYMDESESVA